MNTTLIDKYDVPGPRYTSYPSVPDWDGDTFTPEAWHSRLRTAVTEARLAGRGADLYLHLPFCESLCTFCGCTKRITRNHAVEAPYIDAVVAELDHYVRVLDGVLPVASIHLGGGTPTFFSSDQLSRLIEAVMARVRPVDSGVKMSVEAHPGVTSAEQIETLAGLGFSRLSLGVQDFDPLVQKAIHRTLPESAVAAVIEQARASGFTSVSVDLVYGLPHQRPESVEATVERILGMRPDRVAYYGYAHVPWIGGTGQRGFDENDIPRGAAKRRLYEIARERFMSEGYREVGLDHFALADDDLAVAAAEGRLNRSFMGYTADAADITLGLGASSISDCGTAFAQNDKAINGYQSAATGQGSAVVHGHLMSGVDRTIGRHIQDLMCNLRTRWASSTPASGLGDAMRTSVAERLGPMADDGLVELGQNEVRVTETGRGFLRNICMAFDPHRGARDADGPRFSRSV